MLSLGYLVAVLAMIRVGEKILQKVGAKLPMVWGAIITTVGVAIMGLTFLPDFAYTVVVFIGFALFGLGLGIYATPSTDTSVSNAPSDKVGEAAGVYKMASSLGSAFGVAISATVYGAIAANGNLETAASVGIIVNVIFGILSIIIYYDLWCQKMPVKHLMLQKNHLLVQISSCRIINSLKCKTPHVVAFSKNNEGMKR